MTTDRNLTVYRVKAGVPGNGRGRSLQYEALIVASNSVAAREQAVAEIDRAAPGMAQQARFDIRPEYLDYAHVALMSMVII